MKNYDVGHVPLRLPRAKQLLGVIDRYAQQSASPPPKYTITQIPPKYRPNTDQSPIQKLRHAGVLPPIP